jgi:hypothetical protein
MQLVTGRNFLEGSESENDKVIVNEAFLKAFSLQENPLGQSINQRTNNEGGLQFLNYSGCNQRFSFPIVARTDCTPHDG